MEIIYNLVMKSEHLRRNLFRSTQSHYMTFNDFLIIFGILCFLSTSNKTFQCKPCDHFGTPMCVFGGGGGREDNLPT